MADEITTTTANDYVFDYWILASNILPYFYGLNVAEHLVRVESLAGLPTLTHNFPTAPQLAAAGLTQGVDMANSPYATGYVAVTAAESGIRTEPLDILNLSSVVGQDQYVSDMGGAMAAKRTSDILALGAGFSNACGATTVNLSEANIQTGITGLMARGVPGPYHGCMHPQQYMDLAGSISTTLTWIGSGAPSPRAQTNDLGSAATDGMLGELYGVNWTVSSLVPTATAGADRSGMIVNPRYAIGLVEKFPLRVEPQRDASLRATELNVVSCYGQGELLDDAGCQILSDA